VTRPGSPDLDEVLEAFASEPSPDDAILTRYARRYPQFALALVDLAHELRLATAAEDEDSTPDSTWQEASWRKFKSSATSISTDSPSMIVDPFAGLTPTRLAAIRSELQIPSTVLNGFRDRLVLAATVPRRFTAHLAAALNTTFDHFEAFLALPPRLNQAASYKADATPRVSDDKITFALLLEQAMIPPERRRDLLDERD
jgi:hypothetical protein